MSELGPVLLYIVGFFPAFIALWALVCLVISFVSGWQGLARRYGTDEDTSAQELGLTSGRLGLASYRNVLVPAATPSAFHLRVMTLFRVGHKPLRIPWEEIGEEGPGLGVFIPSVRLRLGERGPVLRLQRSTWKRLQEARPSADSGSSTTPETPRSLG